MTLLQKNQLMKINMSAQNFNVLSHDKVIANEQ